MGPSYTIFHTHLSMSSCNGTAVNTTLKEKDTVLCSYREQQTLTINKQNKQTTTTTSPWSHAGHCCSKGTVQLSYVREVSSAAQLTQRHQRLQGRQTGGDQPFPQGFPTIHSLGEKQTLCTTGNQLRLC